MKRALFVLFLAGVIAIGAWGIWASHKSIGTALFGTKPVSRQPAPVELVMSAKWQEYRTARVATLKDNPELAAGYQELLGEMADQQKQMDAAMIKADPKVAPIIAKLALADTALTPAESRELGMARLAALKANPDLAAKLAQLSKDMGLYRSKFSAAMVKTNPQIAPMLAKLGDESQGSRQAPTP